MASVVSTEIDAFVFCGNRLANRLPCPGNELEPIRAIRETVSHTYLDGGGDLGPFEERSQIYLRFCDTADEACPHCGSPGPRLLSETPRPIYPRSNTSDPAVSQADQLTELRIQLAELRAERAAQQNFSAPGAQGAAANADSDTPVAAVGGPDDAAAAAPSSRTRTRKEA